MDPHWSFKEIAPGRSIRTACRGFPKFRRTAPKHNADLFLGTGVRSKEQSCSCHIEAC